MTANASVTRKIAFQTMEMEISLTEVEYAYLRFICEATLRNSDEILREQIRAIQVAGLPSFDQWRQQQPTAVPMAHPTVVLPPVPAEVTVIENGVVANGTVANGTVASLVAVEQPKSRQGGRQRKAQPEPISNGSLLTPPPVDAAPAENGATAKVQSRRSKAEQNTSTRTKRSTKAAVVEQREIAGCWAGTSVR